MDKHPFGTMTREIAVDLTRRAVDGKSENDPITGTWKLAQQEGWSYYDSLRATQMVREMVDDGEIEPRRAGECPLCSQGFEDHPHKRLEIHSGPDGEGRYSHTRFWWAAYHPGHPDGEHAWRERAQGFHASLPEWYTEGGRK